MAEIVLGRPNDRIALPIRQAICFGRTGAPVFWIQEGVLKQRAPACRLIIPIAATQPDGSVHFSRVSVSKLSTPLALPKGTLSVEADPHFEVLHSTPEMELAATESIQVTRVEWAASSQGPMGARRLIDEGLKSLKGPDRYAVEFRLRYYHAQVLYRDKDYSESAAEADWALACVTRRESLLASVYQLLMYDYAAIKDIPMSIWDAKSELIAETQHGTRTQISLSASSWLASH